MAQCEKELLLIDLCARLPYKLNVCLYGKETCILMGIDGSKVYLDVDSDSFCIESIKPYLRKLSSMTEEEIEEYHSLCSEEEKECYESGEWTTKTHFHDTVESIDWLNKKMFAYRTIDGKDMFELGLALKAPDGMYK